MVASLRRAPSSRSARRISAFCSRRLSPSLLRLKQLAEVLPDGFGQPNGNGVSDLSVLRYFPIPDPFGWHAGPAQSPSRPRSAELVPVREGLQPCPLSHRQAARLG